VHYGVKSFANSWPAASISFAAERPSRRSGNAKLIFFCSPHLILALAVVKREGITGDTSIKGLRIGVRRGTTAEHYAKYHEAPEPSQISESNEKLYASLAAGELDAVIDDFSHCKVFFSVRHRSSVRRRIKRNARSLRDYGPKGEQYTAGGD
jgi:hypothetical protein